VPAVPYRNPNNYVKVSGRLAAELAAREPAGAIWANQFDNVANRQAHIESTGQDRKSGGIPAARLTRSSPRWEQAGRLPAWGCS
jgi:hypothetical protein